MNPLIDPKRKSILEALEKVERPLNVYSRNEIGPGLLKLFKRLIRFRLPYLLYLASRFAVRFKPIDKITKTFWEKSIHVPLSDADSLELLAFGLLGGEEPKLTKFLV